MKRVIMLLAFAAFLFPLYGYCGSVLDDGTGRKLDSLEQLAEKKFADGHPAEAVEVYRQYEKVLISEGLDPLQADLLHDQAVSHYRAGALGSAMACMKQLRLIEPSREVSEVIEELQRLIEHRVYQKKPNTQFVRGLPEGYLSWSQTHQFSRMALHCTLIVLWSLFFIALGVTITFRKQRRAFHGLIVASAFLFVLTAVSIVFVWEHHATDDMRFGVLTGVETILSEPVQEAAPFADAGYVPGMTVREISTLPGWYKVECSDGARFWVSSSEYYRLRGAGERGDMAE